MEHISKKMISDIMAENPHVDRALALRLELTEAYANVEIVKARAQLAPNCGACWLETNGSYSTFDGIASPVTQNSAMGMAAPVNCEALQLIETFFWERNCEVRLEISPLTDESVLPLLRERGYHLSAMTSVMLRPVATKQHRERPLASNVTTRLSRRDERELWAKVAARGWSQQAQEAHQIFELSTAVTASPAQTFFAELDERPVATGALWLAGGIALLAGASTIPEQRNQGAQSALLKTRLDYAADHGCDLAMMTAAPGSASQRNAERHGFRIAYTRIKMILGGRQ